MNDSYYEFEDATEDRREEALKAMGLRIEFDYIRERPDMPGFFDGTHYKVSLFQENKHILDSFYTVSRFKTATVSLVEFMYCISIDATTETYEDWCTRFGFDNEYEETRKKYETCRDTFSKLYSVGINLEELNRICYGY